MNDYSGENKNTARNYIQVQHEWGLKESKGQRKNPKCHKTNNKLQITDLTITKGKIVIQKLIMCVVHQTRKEVKFEHKLL